MTHALGAAGDLRGLDGATQVGSKHNRDAVVLPAVAELTREVETWCRGPLAHLTDRAVEDPRVTVAIEDVMDEGEAWIDEPSSETDDGG